MINRQFPLGRWRVRNVKSIREADVELGGLSIVVGANSSGKSTLLQSILAAAQAARSDEYEGAFPLNGPLVDLGDFSDVHSQAAVTEPYLEIGGTFSATLLQEELSAFGEAPIRVKPRQMGFAWRPADLIWDIRLAASRDEEMLGAARLDAVKLTGPVSRDDTDEPPTTFSFQATASEVNQDRIGALPAKTGVVALAGELSTTDSERLEVLALTHQGGVPRQLFGERERVRILLESALRAGTTGGRRARPRPSEPVIAEARNSLIALLSQRVSATSDRSLLPAADLRTWRIDHLDAVRVFEEPGEQESIIRAVIEATDVDEKILAPIRSREAGLEASLACAGALSRFLARRVLYLGPLREEPRAAYKPGVADQQTPVGKKGELTAYVLRRYGKKRIIAPGDGVHGRAMSLRDAVAHWMKYLGAAEHVAATGQSRYGIGLRVRPADVQRDLDLTAVGVGVSQVLPVVTLCLFADPGSLLILEQPELHLHPATQQRLADFFIACMRSGRQIIVETHSDHLISRLRLRIAEEEGSDLRSNVAFLFAERSQGATSYRRVTPTPYGTIEEWPDGFFDQAARESQAIFRAGAEKKKRERNAALHQSE